MQAVSAFGLAAIVVPAYVGLLHVWLYLWRRREPLDAGFGVAAIGMAGIAAAGLSRDPGAGGLASSTLLLTLLPLVAAALAISAVLVGRFVGSMAEAERLSARLHELVEERSRVLREKELQLAHGEQLASLGALAAGVARAIHEPIRSLASHVTRLGALQREPDPGDEVPRILADCRQGLERVRVVVAEVLAIARRSDGEMEPVDLSSVVASVLPILRPLANERVELVEDLAPVPPVHGDPRLLGQVALQLLLNAVQARPKPGACNRVAVATRCEGGWVRLRVEDSGPAIPPEILPRVFDPFFTPEEGQRGPELGLAVTHQIVARHRGRVRVESDEDGTRVTVDLPPAAAPADDAEAAER